MPEAKRLRAKCLRVRGFEIILRLLFRLPARRRGFGANISSTFRRQQASERSFSIIFRRLEASKRAFSSTFRREEASERAFSTSGGFGAIIFDDFRRLEAPQRGFSRPPACKVTTPPSLTAQFLYRCFSFLFDRFIRNIIIIIKHTCFMCLLLFLLSFEL